MHDLCGALRLSSPHCFGHFLIKDGYKLLRNFSLIHDKHDNTTTRQNRAPNNRTLSQIHGKFLMMMDTEIVVIALVTL
jgi:hypothetical protein